MRSVFGLLCPAVAVRLAVVGMVGVWVAHDGFGQSTDSRPIEFSESRNAKGRATNDQDFRTERRRLSDLEDRLSRTLNFFDQEDTLGGGTIPRMYPRTTAPRPQRKPSRFLEDDGEWTFSDPLRDLLRSLDIDGEEFQGITEGDSRDEDEEQTDFLKKLRSDDWLVNGTLGDEVWGSPLPAEVKYSAGMDGYDAQREELDDAQRPSSKKGARSAFDDDRRDRRDRRTETDALSERGLNDSSFSGEDSTFEAWTKAEDTAREAALKLARQARREEYLQLLGVSSGQPTSSTRSLGLNVSSPLNVLNQSQFTPQPQSSFLPDLRSRMETDPRTSMQALPTLPTTGQADLGSFDSRRFGQATSGNNLDLLYPTAPSPPELPRLYDPLQRPAAVQAPQNYNSFPRPTYQLPVRPF